MVKQLIRTLSFYHGKAVNRNSFFCFSFFYHGKIVNQNSCFHHGEAFNWNSSFYCGKAVYAELLFLLGCIRIFSFFNQLLIHGEPLERVPVFEACSTYLSVILSL